MKKQVLTILCCLGAMLSFSTKSNAQTTVVYYWNFSGGATDSVGHTPVITASGAGTAHIKAWDAYTDFAYPGSLLNIQPGYNADSAIRFRNPADSIIISMPATGYQNLKLSYAEQRTSSGSAHNSVLYTTDGINYVPTCTTDLIDSCNYTVDSIDAATDSAHGWELHTFSFAADVATKNNPHFAVAIVFNDGPGASSGNDRFDNITLKGDLDLSTGIATVASAPATYTLSPNPAGASLNINASVAGERSFTIYNAIGQQVYNSTTQNQDFSINTSNLNAGIYILSVKETNTGNTNTMKFIKQ